MGNSATPRQYLVDTAWLQARLEDAELRVLECTVLLHALPGHGYRAESGRTAWAAGHIPGSGFADLAEDLADRAATLNYMLPPPEQFAAGMSRLGVGEGTRVVLYDRAFNMWAARLWWMLRAFGFDRAAVLDGGWRKWTGEGRPVSTAPCAYPAARFVPAVRPGLFVGKAEVLAALGNRRTCIVNALTEEQHRGTGGVTYGRPGRIPGSENIPARSLVDPTTHAYLGEDALRAGLAGRDALGADRVITYCGGGIAASSLALVLAMLGHERVAIYDGSLSEWAADPTLPMERD